jgi:hypothetical protein
MSGMFGHVWSSTSGKVTEGVLCSALQTAGAEAVLRVASKRQPSSVHPFLIVSIIYYIYI